MRGCAHSKTRSRALGAPSARARARAALPKSARAGAAAAQGDPDGPPVGRIGRRARAGGPEPARCGAGSSRLSNAAGRARQWQSQLAFAASNSKGFLLGRDHDSPARANSLESRVIKLNSSRESLNPALQGVTGPQWPHNKPGASGSGAASVPVAPTGARPGGGPTVQAEVTVAAAGPGAAAAVRNH